MSSKSRVPRARVTVVAMLSCALALGACAELGARRTVQKADKLSHEGRFSEAIELYEKALLDYDLPTAHHNLAISAFSAYQPGVETKSNLVYATKAAEHFQKYLKVHPGDQEIIALLTTVWLDSDQLDVALSYWEKRREARPNSSQALSKLSSIHRMQGEYEKALTLDYQRVELATDPKIKARVLTQIGQLQYRRLTKASLVDEDRLKVADSGLAALQQAVLLQPENANLHSLMATIYQFRSLAQQTSWARTIDVASQRYHFRERKKIIDAAKAKSATSKSATPVSGETPSGEASSGAKTSVQPPAGEE